MQDQNQDSMATRPFQQRTTRHMTVLVNAAIGQHGRDGLCRIRNMSVGGLAIETSLSLVTGETAIVTLASGRELPCIVRWTRDGQAGMSCDADPTALLHDDRAARSTPLPGPAPLRFYRIVAARIRLHGRDHRCNLDSISTSDVLMTGTPPLRAGEGMVICVLGLGEFPATATIAQDGDLFARFTPHISFRLMDEWLATNR